MNRTDIFIEKFKELEKVTRKIYNLERHESISRKLTQLSAYRKVYDEIRYCQDVRNLIQHSYKISNKYTVEPTQEMIDFLDDLINKVAKRPLCKSIAVPLEKIYARSLDDNILETMHVMREKTYTVVPIMDNGKIIGAFDENSMFSYMCDNEIVAIDSDETFEGDIGPYLEIENREMEQFCFVSSKTYVDEVYEIYERCLEKGIRLSAVFVTENGKKEEKLVGLITPWDILGMQ